ncbi:MAG: dTDP-4-dehydrorhamnose 3,5-epimerase family protein [Pirellulales bacterium]|nr:dTDP-4-dehydrorhamnose 3,5-epimerase family protein [Pirellulales bacterium]
MTTTMIETGTARRRRTTRRTSSEFLAGEIDGVLIRAPQRHRDGRGWLVELFREDELAWELRPRMSYVSETQPGQARGPHEHQHQTDCFAFIGPGDFEIYLWDNRKDSATYRRQYRVVAGVTNPCIVIIPPGVVHAYRCLGNTPGWVFNAPNQLYAGEGRRSPVDEIRHEDDPDSPYVLD